MRKDITVAADVREGRGKNEARRLRAAGRAPAVVYGAAKETLALSVNPKEIVRILHSSTGHNTIFDLDIKNGEKGEKTPVMIVDWQFDPVRDNLLHVDLKRIDLTKRLRVSIPVHTHGDPKGVKQQGGLLEIVTREIEVECLPDEIPEHLTIEVADLMIGQNRRASAVPLAGSMTLLSPSDTVIAHVIELRHHEEAPAAAAEAAPAAAEPEVIKKGRKEEEAGEEKKK
jgi:large subunit ribosomal protein L25